MLTSQNSVLTQYFCICTTYPCLLTNYMYIIIYFSDKVFLLSGAMETGPEFNFPTWPSQRGSNVHLPGRKGFVPPPGTLPALLQGHFTKHPARAT